MLPFFTTLALDEKPLPLYASTDHKREWLHVLDHCRAVEQIVLRGRDGETYNVGSGREATIDEIADLVLDTLGMPDSLKTIVPDRPGHDRRYLLDAAKLRRELGWAPEVEFDPGMRATVEWYASNRVVGAAARPCPGGGDGVERRTHLRPVDRCAFSSRERRARSGPASCSASARTRFSRRRTTCSTSPIASRSSRSSTPSRRTR